MSKQCGSPKDSRILQILIIQIFFLDTAIISMYHVNNMINNTRTTLITTVTVVKMVVFGWDRAGF